MTGSDGGLFGGRQTQELSPGDSDDDPLCHGLANAATATGAGPLSP